MDKSSALERYTKIKSANHDVGDYLLVSAAVCGMNYNKKWVTKLFNEKVPKDDYAKNERDRLLENLWSVNSSGDVSKNTALLSH